MKNFFMLLEDIFVSVAFAEAGEAVSMTPYQRLFADTRPEIVTLRS